MQSDQCATYQGETRANKKGMGFVKSPPTLVSVIVLYGNFSNCII